MSFFLASSRQPLSHRHLPQGRGTSVQSETLQQRIPVLQSASHGGGTTESFARSEHDRRGDMDGVKSDSASFWSRCIFFHESTTPTRQTRETKKSNNRLSKQRNKPTKHIHRNQRPCGDDINFSQNANAIPVCSPSQLPLECELHVQPSRFHAHCFCVREGSDDSRGATPRFADGNLQPFVNFVQGMECPFD